MTERPATSSSCSACALVSGEARAPGGVLFRGGGFLLHALVDPSPRRGWLVLTSERHARGWADLSQAELEVLGPLAARVMRAQAAVLGADHVYAFAIGELLPHFHLHLVPRYPETPEHLRGRRCFEAKAEEMLPLRVLEEAAQAVGEALRASSASSALSPNVSGTAKT